MLRVGYSLGAIRLTGLMLRQTYKGLAEQLARNRKPGLPRNARRLRSSLLVIRPCHPAYCIYPHRV